MNDLLLPPASHLIHIGPHKTGSTAIQAAFHESRDVLARHGVHYAGKLRRPRRAGWAIGLRGRPAETAVPPMRAWHRLVEDVADAGDARVCISNEDFGRCAEPAQIRRIVDDLGGTEPHVMTVVRPLEKYLPSQWQERVKAGMPLGYDEWLRVVLDRPGEPGVWGKDPYERANVWFAHDTAAVVRRWADVVGLDRITLIVADGDRDLLPRTFERFLGLPENLLVVRSDRSNRSLSWAEAEFVRAVHQMAADRDLPKPERRRLISRGFVMDMVQRSHGGSPPPLPPWAADIVRERSQARLKSIRDLDVRIIGNVESLNPTDLRIGEPSDPPGLPPATAARAVDWLMAELAESTQPTQPPPTSG